MANLQETKELAYLLASLAKEKDVIVLTGDLGTGKTAFTQSFAEKLGITQRIKSPTYTIIREYQSGRLPLYHMDVYRLNGDTESLGLEEYFEGDGICMIEWGNLIEAELPQDHLEIILEKLPDSEETRRITFKDSGNRSQKLVKQLKNLRK